MAENSDDGRGVKSLEQIRSALAAVRDQEHARATPGPMANGAADDHRIVLAEFFDSANCERFQRTLSGQGIMYNVSRRGRKSIVMLDASDRVKGAELLAQHLLEHPDERASGHRRDWDSMIFGAILMTVVGGIFLIGQALNAQLAAALVTLALLGAMIGRALNLLQQTLARRRKLQFGMQETFTLVAIVALVMYLYQAFGRG